MKSRILLSSAGTMALAGALVAAPAYASEGEAEGGTSTEEVSEEDFRLPVGPTAAAVRSRTASEIRIDTFAGIDDGSYTAAVEVSLADLAEIRLPSAAGTGPTLDPQLISRADVDPNAAGFVDVAETQPSVVQIFSQRNSDGGIFLNCTGSLINPRTVLTAAHCVTANTTRSSEAYGLPETGAERTMLIGTGFDTSGRFFEYLDFGTGYTDGGLASSTDVIIHSTANVDEVGLPFPWADIALIAVDAPITDIPTLDILLTPLTELTHVVQAGYGTFGDAFGGGTAGSSFLRRVGENMLGALGNFQDLSDVVFSDSAPNADVSQNYYFTDFDWPDRDIVNPNVGRPWGCEFNGNGPDCEFVGDVLALDWFDGDALANEAATAPGDSGSPLIVDQLYDRQVAVAVLSGGITYPGTDLSGIGLSNTYGDISFYNPLYPFFEFITENTAYKYVSAAEGDGVWSDPTRWTQDLDPGFFVDDGTGNLVNGVPTGPEPGIYASGDKLGTVLGVDISGNPEGSLVLPPDGVFFGIGSLTPNSSVLLGPGSTGFVPQNTDGTPGTSFANPAQYFEVHLNRAGRTTVDLNVEIDKLAVNSGGAELFVDAPWSFDVIQSVEQFSGLVEVDGTVNTPFYFLLGGELSGDGGTIDTNALINVAGLIDAGGFGIGSLAIDGDFLQTSGGGMVANYTVGRRRAVSNDSYTVTGTALLGGSLFVVTEDRRVRFGTEFTVLSAGAVDGEFDATTLISSSPILAATSRVEGSDVIVSINARRIRDVVRGRDAIGGGTRGATSGRSALGLLSLADTLDTLRDTRFDQFVGLFDIVDNTTFDTFGATLSSLTPTSAFSQTFTANSFSQRFTGQIAQRTLALRGGSRAAGGFTAAGNASFAIAGDAPTQAGGLGVYGSASGVFLNANQQSGVLGHNVHSFDNANFASGQVGANAFEQLSLQQAGEMTIGADMQVSDGFSFGVAVSEIRNSQFANSALQPQEDRAQSVAIYATYSDGGLFADGYAGASNQRFGVERGSTGDFASLYSNAIGQADGDQTFGGMRVGYAFDLAKGVEVGPVASLDYVRNELGGYDEMGASAFGLSVADRTFTSMGAKIGGMASFDIKTGNTSSVKAFGSVAYSRELADTQDVVTAHFFGAADTPFTIANALDPEWVSVNAGAEMQVGANLRASISVTSDMGRGLLSNDQAQASLSWRF